MILTVSVLAPWSTSVYWYVVRGSGFLVYILLSIGVISGLLLGLRWRSATWPRLLTEEMHQFLQLLALAFLAVHIISTLLETYVVFDWYNAFVPLTGPYRPFWMATGIVAMYLTLALALSIYVRRQIGYRAWRTLHYTGFAAWVLALAHGLTAGSDTRSGWAVAIYGVSAVMVAGLLAARFGGLPVPFGQPPGLRPLVLAALAFTIVLGTIVAAAGPLQRSWAARVGVISGRKTPIPLHVASFHDVISGVARPYNQYLLDPGYRMLTIELDGRGAYPVTLSYRVLVRTRAVGLRVIRGLVAISPKSGAWVCSATVAFRSPDELMSICSPRTGVKLRVTAHIRLDGVGGVRGTLSVQSVP